MERRAAALDCPAALQPMQPMVEQASMFLFRWAGFRVYRVEGIKLSIGRGWKAGFTGFRA
jgi:hypothetical protein